MTAQSSRTSTRWVRRLQRLTAGLSDSLAPAEVAARVLDQGMDAMDASRGQAYRLAEGGKELELLATRGYPQDLSLAPRIALDADQPLTEAFRRREPLLIASPAELARRFSERGPVAEAGACACIPLTAGAAPLGVVVLLFDAPRSFTERARRLLDALADLGALALERARLHEAEREAREEAEQARRREAFLARAGHLLSISLDHQATLRQLADLAVPEVSDWCTIDLAESGGGIATRQVVIAHVDPAKVDLARRLRERYPPDPAAPRGVPRVLRTGEPELYEEVDEELLRASARDAEHLDTLRALQFRSAMLVPIVARGRTLGVITFVAAASERRYGPADLAMAVELGQRAGLAVDNALLYREAKDATGIALVRARQQEALADLGRRALTLPLRQLLDVAVEVVAQQLGVEFAELLERPADHQELLLRAGTGWSPGLVGSLAVPLGLASQAGFTLLQDEPVVIADLATERRFRPSPLLVEHGIRSSITVTIPGSDAPFGVLGAHTARRRAFSDDDAQFLLGVAGVLAGAVARAQAEAEVRDHRDFVEALLDTVGALVVVLDADGRIVRWNPACELVTGYRSAETCGRRLWEFLVPEDEVTAVRELFADLQLRGLPRRFDNTWLTRSGRRRLITWSNTALRDAQGEVAFIIGTGIDVTERARYERELEEAGRHKDEFLAMLGHELRNPLGAIHNAIQLLRLVTLDDPRAVRARDIVDRQVTSMRRLLADLLDLSRIARGKVQLERETLDLVDVARSAVDDVIVDARGKGLDLGVRLPEGPVWVRGDRVRLLQVAGNLLCNAIKFTDAPGRVEVDLEEDGEEVVLRVRDTGVGMDARLLEQVFEPFRQAEQDLSRSASGLGLGLAVVRGLVDLHRGRVAARSGGRDRGSEFEVVLPQAPAPRALKAPRFAAVPAPRRILLVEDNADAAEALREVLELKGHEVRLASDGRQALEAARGFAPDVVLCDLGLPGGLTGYDVARELRAARLVRPETPVVALTGYGRTEDRLKSREAGFDGHLTKPASPDEIDEVLRRAG